ncbi:heme/hemoglobin receptor [Pseudomonas sp. HAR-UPW-AIA-41]|uniref:TonB-dependent hemoglobin/transferrin/lactoferrin family receptor n=1 Tax=Pseudomonas sp. HAR-UPW-AIA-41 TaxID=1985301 RepID=UPI000BB380E1|nr:TonB-dependent hemoglobin/transferrin/lactoferrin family receptor [Pseudomonas sp. HAR-UPW-AIA-41]PAV47971.1 heme/hemoglobin receptor [Pseudomonas sp. HAR-UPW-AIA-41]
MLYSPPFARRFPLLALLLCPPLALASEAQPTQFDTVTVTATHSEQSLGSVPSTVSVVDARQIDQQQIKNMKDLVRYEPGVSVSGTGSRFGLSGISIRGIGGNRVLTQVDGVSVPGEFAFGPFLSAQRNYIDLDTVKQVEIIRGPASTLYGSDAIGGAVSFLTKDAGDYLEDGDDSYARLKTGYDGSDDSWQRSATLAARQGDFDGLLHLSRRTGQALDTYGGQGGNGSSREEANPVDFTTDNLLAKLGWNYADGDRLQLVYERFADDSDTRVRSGYNQASSTRLFGNTYSNTLIKSSDGRDSTDRERVGLEHSFHIGSLLADHVDWQLNYQTSQTRQRTYQERYSWTGAASSTPPGSAPLRQRYRDSVYEEDEWSFNSQLKKGFTLGQTEHLLTYGADLSRSESSDLRKGSEINTVTGLPYANPEPFPLSDFPDPTQDEYALFVQDSIDVGRWNLLAGLRYDYYRMKPDATAEYLKNNPLDRDPSSFSDSHLSPKLAATYQLDDAHSLYGQYAAGFRAPEVIDIFGEFVNLQSNYQTLANTSLKPETSDSFEVGLRGQYAQGSWGLALFYNQYDDFIEQVTLAEDPTGNGRLTFQSQNLDRVTIRGAEARGELFLDNAGLPAGSKLRGSLAYARGKDEESGQPINSIDPLKSVIGLAYDAPSGQFGGELAWTLVAAKERIDDSQTANQYQPSGYGTLDLLGYWQLTEEVSVNGGLYNLTDKQYWQWGDVRGLSSTSAGLGRYSQPGRYMAANLIWEI